MGGRRMGGVWSAGTIVSQVIKSEGRGQRSMVNGQWFKWTSAMENKERAWKVSPLTGRRHWPGRGWAAREPRRRNGG